MSLTGGDLVGTSNFLVTIYLYMFQAQLDHMAAIRDHMAAISRAPYICCFHWKWPRGNYYSDYPVYTYNSSSLTLWNLNCFRDPDTREVLSCHTKSGIFWFILRLLPTNATCSAKSLRYRQDVNGHQWELLTGRIDATDTCAGRAPSWGWGSCRLREQHKTCWKSKVLPWSCLYSVKYSCTLCCM